VARASSATVVSEEQRVTDMDNDQTSDESRGDDVRLPCRLPQRTGRAAQPGAESSVSGVEGLPAGSALLVVKRARTPDRAFC